TVSMMAVVSAVHGRPVDPRRSVKARAVHGAVHIHAGRWTIRNRRRTVVRSWRAVRDGAEAAAEHQREQETTEQGDLSHGYDPSFCTWNVTGDRIRRCTFEGRSSP